MRELPLPHIQCIKMISKILALILLLCGVLTTALPNAACTNPLVRKEWCATLFLLIFLLIRSRRTLDKSVQTEYLKAVVCLTKKAAITPSSVAPGAKNRIDDFVATHIIQFMNIHFVVSASYSHHTSVRVDKIRDNFFHGIDTIS